MRIEKTDMEFVTFDAQDVIMTSTPIGGGDTFKYLNGIVKYMEPSENPYKDLGAVSGKTYSSGGMEDSEYITGLPSDSDTFFNMKSKYYFSFSSEELPTGDGNIYEKVDVSSWSLDQVLDWLKGGSLQKQ